MPQKQVQNDQPQQGRNMNQGPRAPHNTERVNHVKVKTTKVAQDVVLGMFLVNSQPAIVFFDTDASHSFITARFVAKHGITTCTMKNTMLVKSPGGKMDTNVMCLEIYIKIRGVDFPSSPIVLESEGIDLILRMIWLARWNGVIQCTERMVSLTAPSGEKVEVVATIPSSFKGAVNHLEGSTIKNIRVVCEFLDIFPDNLPGMPPEREIEFIIELLPSTAPISKRPYRCWCFLV